LSLYYYWLLQIICHFNTFCYAIEIDADEALSTCFVIDSLSGSILHYFLLLFFTF